jgi:hypothetical protein
MRASPAFLLALILVLGLTGGNRAQFGRPPPPVVPPRPPVVPPRSPVVPRGDYHGSGSSGSSSDAAGWVCPVVVIGGVVFGVLIVISQGLQQSASTIRIRIVAVPPGEAPERVRRAWVGLELPLANGETGLRDQSAFGALSNDPVGLRKGYAVDGGKAVELLAAKDPDAAEWWRGNAPHVLARGYQFVFPAEVCERVEERDH